MIKSFFSFLHKVLFGRYDEMTWHDLNNLVVLMALITAILFWVLRE